jgi:hypothetical protein
MATSELAFSAFLMTFSFLPEAFTSLSLSHTAAAAAAARIGA